MSATSSVRMFMSACLALAWGSAASGGDGVWRLYNPRNGGWLRGKPPLARMAGGRGGTSPLRWRMDFGGRISVGRARLDEALDPHPAVPVDVGQLHAEPVRSRGPDHRARPADHRVHPRHQEREPEVLAHLQGLGALEEEPVDAQVHGAPGEGQAALEPPLDDHVHGEAG